MIRDIPVRERPMERLLSYGAKNISDSELLANIIRSGNKNVSALEIAQKMISDFGDIGSIGRLTVAELMQYEGIGTTRACQIVSAFELGRRAKKPFDVVGRKISNPSELVDFFKYELSEEEVEKFAIVNLSSSHQVLSWEIVSVGILNASLVHPREVFKQAIRACSSSIIALHNHPSGNCTPSKEDFLITRRIYQAGELVGISLLDHIVIAGDMYYSFSEHEHLPPCGR